MAMTGCETVQNGDEETGLDYFETRYMSGAQGRFTSPDSYNIVFEMQKGKDAAEQRQILDDYLSNPQQWNKYAYVLNNPLKYIDPDGRNACGTNDDSTCKVTVTIQDRTKESGRYNDQFTGVANQQNYNATATVTVTNTATGQTTAAGVFLVKTTPSDATASATAANGTYTATLDRYKGTDVLRLQPTDHIPTIGPNPSRLDRAWFATGILVHPAGRGNFTGVGTDGRPVSQGCQTVCTSQYADFLHSTGITPDRGSPQRHFTVTLDTLENRRIR